MPGCLNWCEKGPQQTRLNLSPTGRVALFPSVLEERIKKASPPWKRWGCALGLDPALGEGFITPLKRSRPILTCSKITVVKLHDHFKIIRFHLHKETFMRAFGWEGVSFFTFWFLTL